MVKKLLSLLMSGVIVFTLLSGCGSNGESGSFNAGDEVSKQSVSNAVSQPEKYYNNLTGLYELDSEDKTKLRPIAAMINNITVAQKVQSGLENASIVYETYVEGGITRLLAVFKDMSDVGTLGSMRSARYSYIDLACGHDALYLHAGLDPDYCQKRMKELNLDNYNLNSGYGSNYNFRVKNGLATEHTMFTNGELIYKGLNAGNRRLTVKDDYTESWLNFAEPNDKVILDGGKAENLSVYFSGSYVTKFTYDAKKGKYLKFNRQNPNVDAKTGEQYSYKNVFVLFTSVGLFPDNYRVYSQLNGGDGYYFTNGTYQKVKWSKGGTYSTLKITAQDGSEIDFSAGNSYVCITDKNKRDKTAFS